MKRRMALLLAMMMLAGAAAGTAETDQGQTETTQGVYTQAPEMPDGGAPGDGQQPPEMPEGGAPGDGQQPPEMPEGGVPGDGQQPPEMPDGNGGPGGPGGAGGPGGMSTAPSEYQAVLTPEDGTVLQSEEIGSTGTDENAVLVTEGDVTLEACTVERTSEESQGGDSASFYGVGAAILTTGGSVSVSNSEISTTANGAAGVFAYGNGVATVANTMIVTTGNTAGGIHVAGGGTLNASDLYVETSGQSSAAIRSDRGGGTMTVDGGSYTTHGVGSPAVYVTADISIQDATLKATGSEALCLEGRNSVKLSNCDLSGAMSDDAQNDNTWTVILYQSMSGDSEVGKGTFCMDGGTLISENGGLFYTTNTESEFVLNGVDIIAAEDCEYFLRCTGNSNQRGWGKSGENGADCTFTAIAQQLPGDVIWDSISELTLYLSDGSELIGAVIDDEGCAGNGGDGSCRVIVDESSAWVVTEDSTVTELMCAGKLIDADGRTVSVVGTDGNVYVEGTSEYTVTCTSFSTECDMSGAGSCV